MLAVSALRVTPEMRGKMGRLFEEDFALVIVTGYPEEFVDVETGEFRSGFLDRIRRDAEGATDSTQVDAHPTSYGYGADTLALAVLFSGLSAVFLSGKSIQDNLDGWIKLGLRLRDFVSETRQKYGMTLLSEPAAFAIALQAIKARSNDLPSVVLLHKSILRIQNWSLKPEAHQAFTEHPDRYYVFEVLAGGEGHIVGVNSCGEVLFHHMLPLISPGPQ